MAPSPVLKFSPSRGATRGRIRLAGRSDGVTASVEYAAPSSGAKSSREGKGDSRRSPDTTSGDLEQSRRITERTILAIAKLLSKEDQDD
jgi:hypothetical protein